MDHKEVAFISDKKDDPLVSVIVPAYNSADVIGETIEGILQQTYRNMEVIIIDDASTDATREVILSYQDKRIKPIFLDKNRNVCHAANVGLQAAFGKYVAMSGHDDLWKKDKLRRQIQFLEDHPTYSVCFTWADIIDENGNKINQKWNRLYQLFHSDNLSRNQWVRKLLLEGNSFCAASACVRSELFQKTGYFRYGLLQLQDYDLWLRLLLEGPVYVLQENLTLYRRFDKAGRNLSEINPKTTVRNINEVQWIVYDIIDRLSDEDFSEIFKEEFGGSKVKSKKEILCEKAILLWAAGNFFYEKYFIELLEDEECRSILEEKYHITLQDFYELNSKGRKICS